MVSANYRSGAEKFASSDEVLTLVWLTRLNIFLQSSLDIKSPANLRTIELFVRAGIVNKRCTV